MTETWLPMTPRYIPAQERLKLGHITPSSNTVLEPMTSLMSRDLDSRVSHHFARISVEAITLDVRHTNQFTAEPMLEAAGLLADAGVDAIVWNGTSGGWNGIDADRALCALIAERTGVPCSTSTLAQLELFELGGFSRCALAVPYTDDVTARIVEVFAGEGVTVTASASAHVSENRAMAFVSESQVRGLVRAADTTDAECVLIYCTGVAGAHLAQELEAELGKPVFDSVAVALWKGLHLVGIEPRLTGWGSLMAGLPLAVGRRAPTPDR
ncbi:MAG: maleate cis-trans isomerase family protein [Solirubrobacteraceae bacterium]